LRNPALRPESSRTSSSRSTAPLHWTFSSRWERCRRKLG
jgi:hypothetical protein